MWPRSSARPTRPAPCLPTTSIPTGASWPARQRPRCCMATSFHRWVATPCLPTSTPPGTRCHRRCRRCCKACRVCIRRAAVMPRPGAMARNDAGRSMAIRFDDSALATQLHPIARVHPETGRTALFVSPGYTIGIDGMPDSEAGPLLQRAVPAPGPARVHLPPPLAAGHAAAVGQPLPGACRHRRLRRPPPPAAPHHRGRAGGRLSAARQNLAQRGLRHTRQATSAMAANSAAL